MFAAVKCMAPVEYSDPWAAPQAAGFADRLRALGRGRQRIAYFYETPDTSTFRYRVWNMIEAIDSAGGHDVSAAWFCRADLGEMDRFIDRADVLVLCRTRYSASINRLITRARARGVRILFDVDDLVFDPRHAELIMETHGADADSEAVLSYYFSYITRLGAVLRLCDGVIVTNAHLARCATDYAPDLPAHVIPNFLNQAQIALSETIYQRKQASGFAGDGCIHLGYFSGTPTHNRDFQIISGVLDDLLDSDPRLAVTLVGLLDITGPILRHRDRVNQVGLQDFLNLQIMMGATEINLVPLQDNVFTNCKSELKFFEAAVVGSVTVATPTFCYRQSICDGENGLFARAQDWRAVVMGLLADWDNYPAMAARAHDDALANFSSTQQGNRILSAVFGRP
jgi:hypothetical protein